MTEQLDTEQPPSQIEWQNYYKLQYERIQQHEAQRVQFSGLIMTGSLAALAILIRGEADISSDGLLVGVITIVAVNLICVLFVLKSRDWVKFHQARARVILEKCEPQLLSLMKDKGPKKPNSNWDLFSRSRLQIYLHLMPVVGSLALWKFYT